MDWGGKYQSILQPLKEAPKSPKGDFKDKIFYV
jgi:hypothetical protein